MKNIRLRVGLGAFVIIAIAIGLFLSISKENITYYQTVNEILKNPKKDSPDEVRVMGLVQSGTSKWEPDKLMLTFQITEDGKNFLSVRYKGIKPDMFREGQGVVAEGTMGEFSEFNASTLLVKHSEEYKAPNEEDLRKKYYKSLEQGLNS